MHLSVSLSLALRLSVSPSLPVSLRLAVSLRLYLRSHVLNSPRSLRACSRIGCRPIDLLPRGLQEFSDTYGRSGYSADTIRQEYHRHENRRRLKLALARAERNGLVRETVQAAHRCCRDPAAHAPSASSYKMGGFGNPLIPATWSEACADMRSPCSPLYDMLDSGCDSAVR